jgi:hypothetical protein
MSFLIIKQGILFVATKLIVLLERAECPHPNPLPLEREFIPSPLGEGEDEGCVL